MGFQAFPIENKTLYNADLQMYPSRMIGFKNSIFTSEDISSHFFGYVLRGNVNLSIKNRPAQTVLDGQYFSVPGAFALGGKGEAILFQRIGYRGLFSIGGPVESAGRLCYIDHSRTTLLVSPPRNGDPCLNLLTFPAGIEQTPHIHPSLRLGIVVAGSGSCLLNNSQKVSLEPGLAFCIEEGMIHCFHSGKNGLSVIAYHPDSDGGPTDFSHPMLNRTYIQK
jgi:hypothetical protein